MRAKIQARLEKYMEMQHGKPISEESRKIVERFISHKLMYFSEKELWRQAQRAHLRLIKGGRYDDN
jgi:hypothetical protein